MESSEQLELNNSKKIEKSDMSYSIFLEGNATNKSIPPLRHALPRRSYSWTDDNSATHCYNCQKEFYILLRKHHCRHCCKIFCHNCSNYWQNIPETMLSDDSINGTWNNYFTSYMISKDDKKIRVCITCNELLDTITKVKKLIDVLIIANLDVKQLKKIGQLGRLWHSASNYCLSIFREIQYKLVTDKISKDEKQLLWINRKYLSGHSKYMSALIKSCETEEEIIEAMTLLSEPKKIKCNSLMCTRNCKNMLSAVDSINLLGYCFRYFENTDLIKRVALKYLICSDREFKCYISFLVYHIRHDDGILADWLIKRCLINFELLSSLYWEITLYHKDINYEKAYTNALSQLKKIFSNKLYESKFVRILEESSFVKMLEEIGQDIFENKQKYSQIRNKYILKTPISTPLNTQVKITKFHLNKIQIKNSFSKPMVVPCETMNGDIIKLLYKREDVRKDQIILSITNLMEILVKEEEGIDLGIVNYKVFPLDNNRGIIEIIDDSDTLYFIKEKIQSSILNYIMEKNNDLKIGDLRDKFIKSTAGYCVLTYLLGVGDRHLDNIMVTKDGRLFHIDYGYILGNDPVFWNTTIRITPEIIEAIGGFQSEKYVEFKDICSKIFNVMRRNINLFMNIILLLPKISDINISEKDIEIQMIKRFMPGENEIDAQMYFVKNLEHDKIGHSIKDFCHYHSKERTISSGANRLLKAVSGLWKPDKIEYIEDEIID
jgi:hypothetical protein